MDRRLAKEILLSNLPVYLEQKGININKKFHCLCPEHMDNTPSMQYDKRRNNCHCFSCGANANIFKLIEWDYNTTSFEESFQIGCDLFGLDVNNKTNGKKHTRINPVQNWKGKEKKEQNKAPNDVRNKVYQTMRDLSPLSNDDIDYLKNVRGLSEKRIKKDYFRLPSDENNKAILIKKLIRITGYNINTLKYVPGFFVDKKSGQLNFHSIDGIAILIRNIKGQAHAVQIRNDSKDKGRRYSWFSSGFAADNDDLDGGCSPGAAKDVLIPQYPKKCICITEGRFKSELLLKEGNIVISIQGVSTWKGINEIIAELLNMYEITGIFMMFDSDTMGNPQVMNTLKSLALSLKADFPSLLLATGAWKIEYGKGIDDCILNGHIHDVKFIPAITFFEECSKTLYETLKDNGYTSLKKVEPNSRKIIKNLIQSKNEAKFCM